MNMKLDGLIPLYKSMKSQVLERYRFEYRHGKAVFDVFFFIDENPFVLLFGVKGTNFSFEIKVRSGFEIEPFLNSDIYHRLCEELDLEYDPNNKFSPKGFFDSFNQRIPAQSAIKDEASPCDIAKYRNTVEDINKVYFLCWRDNTLRNENVSDANLLKTKELLGERAYQICQRKNISSCWTDKPAEANKVILPK